MEDKQDKQKQMEELAGRLNACAYAYSHAGTNCHTGTHCHAGTYGRTRQGKGRRPWADRGTVG